MAQLGEVPSPAGTDTVRMPGREARSPGCPLAQDGHDAGCCSKCSGAGKAQGPLEQRRFLRHFWTVGGFSFQRRENAMKPHHAAGQMPGSAAAAQQSFPAKRLSRHKATRGWCSPSPPGERLGCTSLPAQLSPSRDGAARAWQGSKRPQIGSCGGKPRRGARAGAAKGRHCTGMLLLVPVSGASMHENILGHLWELQGFGLVLHERSSHTHIPTRGPGRR